MPEPPLTESKATKWYKYHEDNRDKADPVLQRERCHLKTEVLGCPRDMRKQIGRSKFKKVALYSTHF